MTNEQSNEDCLAALRTVQLENTRKPIIKKRKKLTCPECRRLLVLSDQMSGEYICESCGYHEVRDTDVYIPGYDSGEQTRTYVRVQSTDENRIKQLSGEYYKYNKEYVERGGIGFSKQDLDTSALAYAELGECKVIRRNNNKRQIMGAILHRVSKRDKKEICDMFGLGNTLAIGEKLLNAYIENGTITTLESIENDSPDPVVNSLFIKLDATNISYNNAKKFVKEVLERCESENIACSSNTNSKLIGITYLTLSTMIPDLSIEIICDKCPIRKNTLQKFLTSFLKYYNHFIDLYEKYNIMIKSPN
jgi:transcription elongation factor Elf1